MRDILNKALSLIKESNHEGQINVFMENIKTCSFTSGKINELTEGNTASVGIKIIDKEGKTANSVTNIITEDGILDAVKKCLSLVKYCEPEENNGISNEKDFINLDWTYDQDTENVSLDTIMEMAKSLEEKARAIDKRIQFVRNSKIETKSNNIIFANTNDVFKEGKYTLAMAQISLSAVEEGKSSMGFEFDINRSYKLIDLDKVAKNVAKRAISGLNAVILNSGRYDIILSPYVSASLLGVMGMALSGENVCKGKSFLKDKIDTKIANENVTLVNDPINKTSPSAASFDNEGINTKEFSFIEKGVLKTYAHNIYSANKLNTKPTGNAFASSGNPIPSINAINMHMTPNSSLDEVMNSGKTLYINNVMGLHTADPISGRFSIQISGQVVENGEFKESFRGMTMAGTALELMENIEKIADDFKSMGSTSGSTMLIKNMSVGGK
jgi:PmbA protein